MILLPVQYISYSFLEQLYISAFQLLFSKGIELETREIPGLRQGAC